MKEEEFSEDEENAGMVIAPPTWQEYIIKYRSSLLGVLETQYNAKVPKDFLQQRIEILFPDSNFYFFQLKDDLED